MKIVIASDHRGYKLKEKLIPYLFKKHHLVDDIGTKNDVETDFPVFAFEVGKMVASGEYDYGILICGTGMGMMIAANKVKGVRAVNPRDYKTAILSRQHNDANVLVLSEDMFFFQVKDVVDAFFSTSALDVDKYIRRNALIQKYEAKRK